MFSCRRLLLLLAIVSLPVVIACSESSEPEPVDLAPEACLELQVATGLFWQNYGILHVTFGMDPLCSGDDLTRRHELDVRYDYEADGEWDTDWQDLAYVGCFRPDPLPADVWRARMEVRDAAGNVSLVEAEQTLPPEVPRHPDLGMENLEVWFDVLPSSTGGDSLTCEVGQVVWGWRLEEYPEVVCELYVDGEPVHRDEVPVSGGVNRNCDRGTCFPSFYTEFGTYLTPGVHEITVAIDVTDLVTEVDEANNVRSLSIEIGEDGLPVGFSPASGP